jgi:hypothetical protein
MNHPQYRSCNKEQVIGPASSFDRVRVLAEPTSAGIAAGRYEEPQLASHATGTRPRLEALAPEQPLVCPLFDIRNVDYLKS